MLLNLCTVLRTRREYHQGEKLLIKYHRLNHDMSQGELANACHFQKEFICQIERGQNITRDTRITLARALKVEPYELCKFDMPLKELKEEVDKLDAAFKKKRAEAKRKRRQKRK